MDEYWVRVAHIDVSAFNCIIHFDDFSCLEFTTYYIILKVSSALFFRGCASC